LYTIWNTAEVRQLSNSTCPCIQFSAKKPQRPKRWTKKAACLQAVLFLHEFMAMWERQH